MEDLKNKWVVYSDGSGSRYLSRFIVARVIKETAKQVKVVENKTDDYHHINIRTVPKNAIITTVSAADVDRIRTHMKNVCNEYKEAQKRLYSKYEALRDNFPRRKQR